jgi:hypothetical protein
MKPQQLKSASAWDDGGGWEAEGGDGVDDWNFEEIEKPHNISSFSKKGGGGV